MANANTATLSFLIEPGLKEPLRTAADQERRSMANMVEVMIREHCGQNGNPVMEEVRLNQTRGVRGENDKRQNQFFRHP